MPSNGVLESGRGSSYLRVSTPANLELALEGLVRKVLKEQPKQEDIYAFAADYFENLVEIRGKAENPNLGVHEICPNRTEAEANDLIKLATSFPKPQYLPKTANEELCTVVDIDQIREIPDESDTTTPESKGHLQELDKLQDESSLIENNGEADPLEGKHLRDEEQIKDAHEEIEAPEEEIKSSEDQVKAPEEEIKAPKEEIKAPEEEIKTIEDEIKAPEEEIKAPEEEMKTTEEEIKTTEDEIKAPEEEIKTTEDEIKAAEEMEAPNEEIKAPEEEIKAPEEMEAPNEEIKAPEDEIKAPEGEITKPDEEGVEKSEEEKIKAPEGKDMEKEEIIAPEGKDMEKSEKEEIKAPEGKETEKSEKEMKDPEEEGIGSKEIPKESSQELHTPDEPEPQTLADNDPLHDIEEKSSDDKNLENTAEVHQDTNFDQTDTLVELEAKTSEIDSTQSEIVEKESSHQEFPPDKENETEALEEKPSKEIHPVSGVLSPSSPSETDPIPDVSEPKAEANADEAESDTKYLRKSTEVVESETLTSENGHPSLDFISAEIEPVELTKESEERDIIKEFIEREQEFSTMGNSNRSLELVDVHKEDTHSEVSFATSETNEANVFGLVGGTVIEDSVMEEESQIELVGGIVGGFSSVETKNEEVVEDTIAAGTQNLVSAEPVSAHQDEEIALHSEKENVTDVDLETKEGESKEAESLIMEEAEPIITTEKISNESSLTDIPDVAQQASAVVDDVLQEAVHRQEEKPSAEEILAKLQNEESSPVQPDDPQIIELEKTQAGDTMDTEKSDSDGSSNVTQLENFQPPASEAVPIQSKIDNNIDSKEDEEETKQHGVSAMTDSAAAESTINEPETIKEPTSAEPVPESEETQQEDHDQPSIELKDDSGSNHSRSSKDTESLEEENPFISAEVKTLVQAQEPTIAEMDSQEDEADVIIPLNAEIGTIQETDEGKWDAQLAFVRAAIIIQKNFRRYLLRKKNYESVESCAQSENIGKESTSTDSSLSSSATKIRQSSRIIESSKSEATNSFNEPKLTQSRAKSMSTVPDAEVWNALEQELEESGNMQANLNRQKLRREDAVQITTTTSEDSGTESPRRERLLGTGELHDLIIPEE